MVSQLDVLHIAEQSRRVRVAQRATTDDVPVQDDTHPRPLTLNAVQASGRRGCSPRGSHHLDDGVGAGGKGAKLVLGRG